MHEKQTVFLTCPGRYSQRQVIAGLADGTLAFFSHSSGDVSSFSIIWLPQLYYASFFACLNMFHDVSK